MEEEKIGFPSNEIAYVPNEFEQNLPTQEEIEFAQQYNDKIFNVNSVIGNAKAAPKEGVVKIELKIDKMKMEILILVIIICG